jgi:hypothetical protein
MSGAYPGTIPMITYLGEDEYDPVGFDREAGDERSWGGVRRRRIFLALQTLPHILFELHYQLGLWFASFLKICMDLDKFRIRLYLLWRESY